MPPWDHAANETTDDQTAVQSAHNARWGMLLFVVYLLFYAGFVWLIAFAPESMARWPFAGVNLAIWYGFGLLGLALLLALIYSWLCRVRGGT